MSPTRLSVTEIDTPAGTIVLVSRGPAVVGLVYKDRWKGMEADLARRFGKISFEENPKGGRAAGALRRYFAGDLGALADVLVDTAGTAFQERVWKALRRIPAGTTWSYAQLARAVGKPSAVRAVAGANARNPVSVVVPCHRVIASDGKLAGYGGGVPRKRWLLAHEGAILA
jgi:methylated-DNA-[protein]-cysteine S-methyltransferase